MNEEQRPSKIAINKVYTRGGDKGFTALVGGQRIPKSHPRIEAYGTVDELNCFVGKAIESLQNELDAPDLHKILIRIQHELFNLGAILATLPEDIHPSQPRIELEHITQLESEMDQFNLELPALTSFILPGGSHCSADLHVCRTVCRRAERLLQANSSNETYPEHALKYLNRLSDAFFVYARWVLKRADKQEVLWSAT